MESTVVFIVILGVLVFFHEWGHFIAAKLSGINVEEFAFGFGPRLARVFKRAETEYTIHAIPLGGFVKLTGMEPGEENIEHGFQAQAIWKRAIVIFAGPLFSFILGVATLLFVGLYWGFPDNNVMPRVGSVQGSSEAAKIDLRAGDTVLAINGIKITDGIQMTNLIHDNPGRKLTMKIERGGRKLTKIAQPRWVISYLGAQWSFMKGDRAVAQSVMEHSAASKAGIKANDKLVSINGRSIGSGKEMVAAIEANDGKQASIVLDRAGKQISVTIKPPVQWVEFAGMKWVFPGGYSIQETSSKPSAAIEEFDLLNSINGRKISSGEEMIRTIEQAGGKTLNIVVKREDKDKAIAIKPNTDSIKHGDYTAIGLLGFVPAPHLVKAGFSESIGRGFENIKQMLEMLFTTLTSSRIKEDVGGPVMIYKATQVSVALGPSHVFWLLGSLSLGLAVVNLIPIPAVLDGGHLILLGIEAVRRKRWSREQMQSMQMVGLALIAVIFVLILVSDVTKILTGQAPQ